MENWALKTLRAIRQEKNVTQEYISEKLNISQSYYGRIENGKVRLNLKILYEILKVLDTDYLDFFIRIKSIEKKSKKKAHTLLN